MIQEIFNPNTQPKGNSNQNKSPRLVKNSKGVPQPVNSNYRYPKNYKETLDLEAEKRIVYINDSPEICRTIVSAMPYIGADLDGRDDKTIGMDITFVAPNGNKYQGGFASYNTDTGERAWYTPGVASYPTTPANLQKAEADRTWRYYARQIPVLGKYFKHGGYIEYFR